MPTYIDDQPVSLTGPSLKELLDAARARLATPEAGTQPHGGPARVVVEILLDGEKLDPETLAARGGDDMSGHEIRMNTADPARLAVDTLEQVRGRLADAATAQKEAATLLQQDQAQAGYEKVGGSVAAWLQVQQAVLHTAMLLGINLDELAVGGQPAHTVTQRSLEQLESLKRHLKAQDPVSLADSLAYEWPELTDQWFELIDTLIETIDR